MKKQLTFAAITLFTFVCGLSVGFTVLLSAQDFPPGRGQFPPPPGGAPPDRGGPPGFGRGGGGPMQQERELAKQFDKDNDGRLNSNERKAAREFVQKERAEGRGGRGPGGRGSGGRGNQEPPQPGPRLAPSDVRPVGGTNLYEPAVLRTFLLDFEDKDWEKELADFSGTDVEIPATLTVDGKKYPNVGVHFRGASSLFTVGEGWKRSLNLALDYAESKQRLYGYKTLNLLNSHTDPTMLRTILFFHVARQYLPAPKANYVRVAINGESWGVYVNAQQFNKEFVDEWFKESKGARWKAPGSPRGSAGLAYLGDDVAEYKRRYEIKTKDDPKSWANLVNLCRVLNETPAGKLEETLAPLLDIDGVLRFLALENALINSDGYWIRASDYSIYQDEKGRFHIFPHDANETFRAPEGPGMGGGQRVNGIELEPLTGTDDPNKPLLAKLLAVPSLRARYLGYIRNIAEQWLDWNKLGPLAKQYQALIAADVQTDTHKLFPTDAFTQGITEDIEDRRKGCEIFRFALVSGLMALIAFDAQGQESLASVRGSASDFAYDNYRSAKGPWSIHVVRVPRRNSPFQIHAVHAQGRAVGLGRLSDQVALLASAQALPVAGINGDFYQRGGPYAGDPRGLQIVEGELISAPSGSVSFWIDALGEAHTTNTVSMFQITWPDGTTTSIGLNGTRRRDGMELYTQAVGSSTRSSGGRELVLEQQENSPWLPLRAGRMYRARVREVREAGDTRIMPGTMVLSISPALIRTIPRVQAGAELIISTATLPSLRGVKTAISGGPVLVRDGKPQRIRMSDSDSYEFSSMTERHPRSAVGWNNDLFFLVEVDGRQRNFSVGMTLNELASYLVELGCRDAMGLDGGGSATLWCNGRIQNRPCDGYERPIANALVVSKKKDSRPSDKATGGAAATDRTP